MRVLLGVANFGENEELQLKHAAREKEIEIEVCERKYTKQGIMQYLGTNPDTDIAILSEVLESSAPFEPTDFEQISDLYEQVRVIPILADERQGTEYISKVFAAGVHNAVFQKDASVDYILDLALTPRSRKDAKVYYHLKDADDQDNSANIRKCIENIQAAESEGELVRRVVHIHRIVSDEEFRQVIEGLSDDVVRRARTLPRIQGFFGEDEIAEKTLPKNGLFGSLSNLGGSIMAGVTNGIEKALASPDVVQPDPSPQKLPLSAVSMDMLYDVISNVTVGFVGNQRRSGATHQAIIAAHYLASKGYRVALADCAEKRGKGLAAFDTIERYRDTVPVKDGCFEYLGVHYYKSLGISSLNRVLATPTKYHFVVVDYGTFSPQVKDDIGRCTIRCAVCGSMPWEVNQLRAFSDDVKFLKGQITYLIRGVDVSDRERQYDWIHEIVGDFKYADVQSDPFSGECYPALTELFNKYVRGATDMNTGVVTSKEEEMDNDKKRLLGRKKSRANSKTLDKKHRGGCVGEGTVTHFITSLHGGCGNTYFCAELANHFSKLGASVCLVTGTPSVVSYLYDAVDVVGLTKTEVENVWSTHQQIIIDAGVYSQISSWLQSEMARTSRRYLLCRSSEDYLFDLAEFINKTSDAEHWKYIFNQIPPADIRKVKKLMDIYDTNFMPLGDAKSISKETRRFLLEVSTWNG